MELLNFLTCLPIFSLLDKTDIQALSVELKRKNLSAGTMLFAQGDPGDTVYIVASGKLQASIRSDSNQATISELGPGDCVGEMALLTGQLRTATVTALEDSELFCLEKSAFDRLVKKYPNLLTGLAGQLLPRFQKDKIKVAMSRLFGKLDEALLHDLLEKLEWRRLNSGETLFRQGEPGDEMYIIVQGRLRLVVKESNGCQRILGEAGAGEYIGEFALLAESGSPESLRRASVYATRLTDMIVVSRRIFENLLCQYPQALLNLTRQIVRRDAVIGKPVSSWENNIVITLIPAHVGKIYDKFAEQVADSFAALGPTLLLNAKRFEELYGKAGISETPLDHPLSLVINTWLDEHELEHRFTIYETLPGLDESGQLTCWAQRSVEDADIILLVVEAGTDASQTAIEKALMSVQCRSRLELVLLHSSDCQTPTGTAGWLARRQAGAFPAQAHHHIRPGNQADFRRMARRIAGKPVGLALSGGGARGWAHVGVLHALEEAGLEFDWVAGASMGAIVAAGCALDWPSRQLHELAAEFSDPKKLLDYTFPYASITSTKHVTNLLQTLYAGADIEDTWHPFFCISANLTHGEERVHTSGTLWKAVRASMAFPGIFAPVLDADGCVLIDGGAANNLPIDRMREMCPTGTVIGVDLLTSSPVSGQYDFGFSLSGWQALLRRFSLSSKKIKAPHLLNIVDGVVYSNNRYRLNEAWRCADLLIKVPVEAYGLLEFDKYEKIIEVGYKAAQEQLKGLRL